MFDVSPNFTGPSWVSLMGTDPEFLLLTVDGPGFASVESEGSGFGSRDSKCPDLGFVKSEGRGWAQMRGFALTADFVFFNDEWNWNEKKYIENCSNKPKTGNFLLNKFHLSF